MISRLMMISNKDNNRFRLRKLIGSHGDTFIIHFETFIYSVKDRRGYFQFPVILGDNASHSNAVL